MLELAKEFRQRVGSTITCGVLYNLVNALFSFSSVSLDFRAGYIARLISVLNFSCIYNSYLCYIGSLKTVFGKQIARQRLISGVLNDEPVSQIIPLVFQTRPL